MAQVVEVGLVVKQVVAMDVEQVVEVELGPVVGVAPVVEWELDVELAMAEELDQNTKN